MKKLWRIEITSFKNLMIVLVFGFLFWAMAFLTVVSYVTPVFARDITDEWNNSEANDSFLGIPHYVNQFFDEFTYFLAWQSYLHAFKSGDSVPTGAYNITVNSAILPDLARETIYKSVYINGNRLEQDDYAQVINTATAPFGFPWLVTFVKDGIIIDWIISSSDWQIAGFWYFYGLDIPRCIEPSFVEVITHECTFSGDACWLNKIQSFHAEGTPVKEGGVDCVVEPECEVSCGQDCCEELPNGKCKNA
jgi:hypothetical protein